MRPSGGVWIILTLQVGQEKVLWEVFREDLTLFWWHLVQPFIVVHIRVHRETNLLREVFGAQEEAEQTSDNNGQHREDEQAVLLTDPFHSHPHCIQRYGHRVSRVHKTPVTLADLHISTTQIQMGGPPRRWMRKNGLTDNNVQIISTGFAQDLEKTLILSFLPSLRRSSHFSIIHCFQPIRDISAPPTFQLSQQEASDSWCCAQCGQHQSYQRKHTV